MKSAETDASNYRVQPKIDRKGTKKQTLFFETVEVVFSDKRNSSEFKTFSILYSSIELNSITEAC